MSDIEEDNDYPTNTTHPREDAVPSNSQENSSSQQQFPKRSYQLHISSIPKGISEEEIRVELNKIFMEEGTASLAPGRGVYSVSLVKEKGTNEVKFGFVRFWNKEDMKTALNCANPPRFDDKGRSTQLRLSLAQEKRVLYFGNLPRSVSNDPEAIRRDLNDIVAKRRQDSNDAPSSSLSSPLNDGLMLKFDVCMDQRTGNSRGFGWATYASHESAIAALKAMQNATYGGNTLTVQFSDRHADDPDQFDDNQILYVKNLAQSVTQDMLMELFGGSEVIEKVSVPPPKSDGPDSSNTHQGFAFIHFKNHEAANAAKERLQSFELHEKKLVIEWSLPERKRRSNNDSFGGGRRDSRYGGRRGSSPPPATMMFPTSAAYPYAYHMLMPQSRDSYGRSYDQRDDRSRSRRGDSPDRYQSRSDRRGPPPQSAMMSSVNPIQSATDAYNAAWQYYAAAYQQPAAAAAAAASGQIWPTSAPPPPDDTGAQNKGGRRYKPY